MQRLLVEGCAGKLDGCTLAASRAPADRRSQLRAAKVKQPRQWRGRAASPKRLAVAHWASPEPLPHSKVGVSSASPLLERSTHVSRQAVQPARHAHTARGRFLQIGGWVQNCLRAKSQYVKGKGCPSHTHRAHCPAAGPAGLACMDQASDTKRTSRTLSQGADAGSTAQHESTTEFRAGSRRCQALTACEGSTQLIRRSGP